MRTADDDSVPVPYGAFELPRPVLKWKPRAGASSRSQPPIASKSDELEDEPTRMMIPVMPRPSERPRADQDLLALGSAFLDELVARARKLWRVGPLRTLAMVAGVALVTYLVVVGVRRGGSPSTQAFVGSDAVRPAAAPIIVQQLNGARQPAESVAVPAAVETTEYATKRSSDYRPREKSLAIRPANKSGSHQANAPVQSKAKSRRAERSAAPISSSSAGLPAWGSEAVRDFSGSKSSKSAPLTAPTTTATRAPAAKPAASNSDIPPPMASYRPQPAPVAVAKPVEPPKPVAPAKPSKPMTMDQVLNQVEDTAQAQRKKAGLKAPKTSKRDTELDELINGAMKSKKK